jgi:hypothetical protein
MTGIVPYFLCRVGRHTRTHIHGEIPVGAHGIIAVLMGVGRWEEGKMETHTHTPMALCICRFCICGFRQLQVGDIFSVPVLFCVQTFPLSLFSGQYSLTQHLHGVRCYV